MSEEAAAAAAETTTDTTTETPAESEGFLNGQSGSEANTDGTEPKVETASEGFLADKQETTEQGKGETESQAIEYDLKLPEGIEESDEARDYLAEIVGFAKQLDFTQEQAEKLLEFDLKAKAENSEAAKKAEEEKARAEQEQTDVTVKALQEEWGADMDKNLRTANRALRQDGPKLEAFLKEKGALNNPLIIQAFHKAGLSLVEDSSHGGEGAGIQKLSAEEILYPDEKKG